MTLGLFLETVPRSQQISVYNHNGDLIYEGLAEKCKINPEKIIFTFFTVLDDFIWVRLDLMRYNKERNYRNKQQKGRIL